jgi:predicted transposase/invertase (TIGR01784 family)
MTKQTTQSKRGVGRYANVLLDRWFKRTFGWAPAKRLMQLLLQDLIPEKTISELSFGPQEHINPIDQGKDIRLDVQCKDSEGNLFIVEIQLAEQSTFYERAIYNSSFVIQEQLPQGSSGWGFAPIYFIGIVNFSIHKNTNKMLYRYSLRETETGEPMTSRLEYVFLELPNCMDPETQEVSPLDRLCYTLGHISEMKERPQWAVGEFYDLLFKSTEISTFAPRERNEYIKDMNTERDLRNQFAFAEDKGKAEGELKKQREIAESMLADGMSVELVSKYSGLPVDELKAL